MVMMAMLSVPAACSSGTTDPSLSNYDTLVLTPVGAEKLEGEVGSPTTDPVRLQVTDETGRAVPNVAVDFRLRSEDGSVSPTTVRSDSRGIVETRWMLGNAAGFYELEVEGREDWVWSTLSRYFFRAWARAGAPETLEIDPEELALDAGDVVALSTRIEDRYGNAVDQVELNWDVADDRVATVDEQGRVSAIAGGTTRVSAVVVDSEAAGVRAQTTVRVSETIPEEEPAEEEPTEQEPDIDPQEGEQPQEPHGDDSGDEPVPAPRRVADLTVAADGTRVVSVAFTEVSDGQGAPADYLLKIRPASSGGTGTSSLVADEEIAIPGTAVGARVDYRKDGLEADTEYVLEIVSYRELDGERVYGEGSELVSVATLGEPASPQLDVLRVTPETVLLSALDESVRLHVVAVDETGNDIDGLNLGWSSLHESVATVDSEGRVIARAAGTALIVAAATCCNVSDTVSVRVELPTQAPRDVSGAWDLTASIFGQVRESRLTLDQTGADVEGELTGLDIGLHDVAGSVDGDILSLGFVADGYGEVTLSLTVGLTAMEGTIEARGESGSAVGTRPSDTDDDPAGGDESSDEDPKPADGGSDDSDAPSEYDPDVGGPEDGESDDEPDLPGAGGFYEPGGFAEIARHDGDSLEPGGWNHWENLGLVEAHDGRLVGHFPKGMGDPWGQRPFTVSHDLHGGTDLYMRFRIRVSANWNGHPSHVNKIGFLRSNDTPGNASPFVLMFRGSGQGALQFAAARQNSCFSSAQENFTAMMGDATIRRGEWHEIEVLVRAPSTLEVWVDGTKTHDYQGTARMGCSSFGWDNWSWDPVWGGNTEVLDRDQTMEIDYFYLSGR